MISAVNAFKAKLCLWTTHLNSRKLTHFPNLEKMSQAIKDKDAFHPDQYCSHLDKVAAEFSLRFGELDIMEDITTFVSNPFQSTDVTIDVNIYVDRIIKLSMHRNDRITF